MTREERKIYSKEYELKNRERIKAYRREWRQKNREKINATRNAWTKKSPKAGAWDRANPQRAFKGFESLLRTRFSAAKSYDKMHGYQNDLTMPFLLEMLKNQGEKCDGMGIRLTHDINSLRAVSIDRIDSNKGHTMDNVHLVSQFYNFGKRYHPESEALSVVKEIKGEHDEYDGSESEEIDY